MNKKVFIHHDLNEIFDDDLPKVWKKVYDTAQPGIVKTDFVKLVLLYKYAGVVTDIDTTMKVAFKDWALPNDCDIYFSLEYQDKDFKEIKLIKDRRGAYSFVRPFQILTWAFYSRFPGNKHVFNEHLILPLTLPHRHP